MNYLDINVKKANKDTFINLPKLCEDPNVIQVLVVEVTVTLVLTLVHPVQVPVLVDPAAGVTVTLVSDTLVTIEIQDLSFNLFFSIFHVYGYFNNISFYDPSCFFSK